MKLTPLQKSTYKKGLRRYVVGYLSAGNCLFSSGRAFTSPNANGPWKGGIDPMTLLQARKVLTSMPCRACAIFKLKPVEKNR